MSTYCKLALIVISLLTRSSVNRFRDFVCVRVNSDQFRSADADEGGILKIFIAIDAIGWLSHSPCQWQVATQVVVAGCHYNLGSKFWTGNQIWRLFQNPVLVRNSARLVMT